MSSLQLSDPLFYAKLTPLEKSVFIAILFLDYPFDYRAFKQDNPDIAISAQKWNALIQKLINLKILQQPDRWWERYKIDAKRFLTILKCIDPVDFEKRKPSKVHLEAEDLKYLSCTSVYRLNFRIDFVQALFHYCKNTLTPGDKKFLSEVNNSKVSAFCDNWDVYKQQLWDEEEWRPLLQYVDTTIPFHLWCDYSMRMEFQAHHLVESKHQAIRKFMLEDIQLGRGAREEVLGWYAYFGDFLQTGWKFVNTEEISKMPYSRDAVVLTALHLITQGRQTDAVKYMQEFMKIKEWTNIVQLPLFYTVYGLSLFLDKATPASMRKMNSLKKRSQTHDVYHGGLLGSLCVSATEGVEAANFSRVITNTESIDPQLAFVYKVIVSRLSLTDQYDSELRKYATYNYSDLFGFWKREAKAAVGLIHDPLTKEEEQPFGGPLLLSGFKPQEKWEMALERLAALMKTTKKPKSVEAKNRILYFMNDEGYFTVKQQKSKDGVTWSKGREVALSSFTPQLEGMTELDKDISAMRESWGKYYVLRGAKVLYKLAGSDRIFTAEDIPQPINVVAEDFRLDVVKNKMGGYEVRSNLDDFDTEDCSTKRYFISVEGTNSYKVIELSPEQAVVLKNFKSINSFPEQAKDQLTGILESLSTQMTVMSDLLDNSSVLDSVPGQCKITFRIQPTSDGQQYHFRSILNPVEGSNLNFVPGQGLASVAATINGKPVRIQRDLDGELANWKILEEATGQFDSWQEDSNHWVLGLREALDFLNVLREHQDECLIEWPDGVKFTVTHSPIQFDNLKLKLSSIDQWLSLDGTVMLDGKTQLKMSEIMSRLRESEGKFIRLNDNDFVAVSEKLRKHLALLDKIATKKKDGLQLSSFNAAAVAALEDDGAEIKSDKAFKSLLDRIEESESIEPTIPEALQADLRSYQVEGFEWLSRLAHWGAGAILADDMGLGKTVQTIALLASQKSKGASLIVVPTSVLYNWTQELQRFAPALRVKVFNNSDREKLLDSLDEVDVVLVTYGVMSSEIEMLEKVDWNVIVLDEAHAIKNRLTQMSKNVMRLKSRARVLLSGTPIQNHLSEIWNLFEFANPGLLGSYTMFADRFIVPIERDHDKEQQKILKQLIGPFILRRTKSEVLNELPEKTEVTVPVELSQEEMALYENIRVKAVSDLQDGEINSIQALAVITKLRQAANHPQLIDKRLKLESSKTAVFLGLVDELIENKHRSLVFSQFTSHLDLIKAELDKRGIRYLYLDGSVTAGQRKKLVEQFQNGDMPLFLISLKAGGIGLNLTGADYVIHLDPWWNPAVEDQASDRAYRIGQKRSVTIYKLIAKNTIEEKIVKLHITKRNLSDALLEGSDVAQKLGKDEILQLLNLAH